MDETVVKRLLELNRQFYQAFGEQFSATRMRLQPGVKGLLARLDPQARLLDLGCGNGELWRALQTGGHQGAYTGLDFSAALIEIARAGGAGEGARFLQADLSEPGWSAGLEAGGYDAILAFAVLHHLPGRALRRRILGEVRRLLAYDGRFYHSEWQFLNSERLRGRLQPWETAGLSDEQVDPGDYLLDWRRGGYGLRYAHHFSAHELDELADKSGFEVLESFPSDGHGGDLGLYQVWRPLHSGAQTSKNKQDCKARPDASP